MNIVARRLWQEKYAARFAELRADEARQRSEAFVTLPRIVVGEAVRLMTPADLHLLDGIGNPLVTGRNEPLLVDMIQLLWILHESNSGRDTLGDNWRRGLFLGRMRRLTLKDPIRLEREVLDYLNLVFLDAPPAKSGDEAGRPMGACFLAPLLVTLAAEIGPEDPMTGRRWSQVALPVVYQYLKVLERRTKGKDYIDRSPSDILLSQFTGELNALRAGRRSGPLMGRRLRRGAAPSTRN